MRWGGRECRDSGEAAWQEQSEGLNFGSLGDEVRERTKARVNRTKYLVMKERKRVIKDNKKGFSNQKN